MPEHLITPAQTCVHFITKFLDMAGVIANYAAKKLLGSQMEKYRSKKVAGDDVIY